MFERHCLRLVIYSILCGRWNDLLVVMGIKCSSFVICNAGTSNRDFLTPMGQEVYESVSSSNRMVSRSGMKSLVKNFCELISF